MRPVGPESAETYWMRRALVVGAMLVLLIIILIFMFNLGGSPGQAAPPSTRSAGPAGGPSSPTPMSPSASPNPSAGTSASPTPSATASAKPSSADSATTSPGPSKTPTNRSDKPSAKSSDKQAGNKTDKPTGRSTDKASSKPTSRPGTKPAAAAACTAEQLSPNLKSKQHTIRAGSKVTFGVAYVNRSDQPCSIKINADDYELRITSGTDRIWSTNDCAKLVRSIATTLKPGDAVVWTITWNGRRSAQGETCKNRPEMPQPGYYHAVSKLKGAPSLDYLLILK